MEIFFKDMTERAIKTAAQTAITMLVGYNLITEVDWYHILGAVGLMTLTSILTSLTSLKLGDKCTASAVKLKEEVTNGKKSNN